MSKAKNFAIIGNAGYIAPRHLKAIRDTGNNLVVAYDPHDSVGIMDSFFPEASFFTEYERFERFVEKQRVENTDLKVDYLVICSPNYLHDAHIRFGLRMGANVICEKPLVVDPWHLDTLAKFEKDYKGTRVNTVLQLRLHKTITDLKKKITAEKKKDYDIQLIYMTPRGIWYDYSWKGDVSKSGGIATNIGIHFFDMLLWIFGEVKGNYVYEHTNRRAAGMLQLEKARVKWFLSINREDLPKEHRAKEGNRAYRLITVNNEELEFSEGFTDLHTKVYEATLSGNGFGLGDARPALDLVYQIRHHKTVPFPRDGFFDKYLTR
jgi:UDP-N-acetyl-2-amino-2-deoxyglucuronate dehydrogenase